MDQAKKYVADFIATTLRCLEDNFGVAGKPATQIHEQERFSTKKNFTISIYFTGTVYGEYILALDERTGAQILGLAGEYPSVEELQMVREDLVDAFSELLNMVVGESILSLGDTYSKLTFTTPRAFFGTSYYPHIRATMGRIRTSFGEVECHFYFDTMRLDLAASYKEALSNLVEANQALTGANQQLKEQQAQLVHAAKMASVGMLAAVVAHEINNPLAFVNSNLGTLTRYVDALQTVVKAYEDLYRAILGTEHDEVEYLREVGQIRKKENIKYILEDIGDLLNETSEGLERIKRIVQGLKDFSRVDSQEWESADINKIINNAVDLVWNQLKYKCEVERNLGAIPEVMCHPGEIGQVIVNLLVNAVQAIPDHGRIEVRTEPNDGEILIRVIDTGCGIDPKDLSRIFEPFFTTKPVGVGTGLGLSISYGIIQRHHGIMEVDSEVGAGTTFLIRLPVNKPEGNQD